MSLGIVAGATLASRAVARLGARRVLIAGMVAQAAGLLLFARVSAHGSYLGDVIEPSLLVTVGLSVAFVAATIAATTGVAPSLAGLASGLVNSSRLVGGALGLAVLAALATARTDGHLHHAGVGAPALHAALTGGFQLGFTVAAGLALTGGLVALVGLPRDRASARPVASPGRREALAAHRAR
jgi:hypothetical protein